MDPDKLRNLIKFCKEPLVFKDVLKWKMLDWDLQTWNEILKDQKMEFQIGRFLPTKEPLREDKAKVQFCTFDNFIKHVESESEDWMYFAYKWLHNYFLNLNEFREDINWAPLGHSEMHAEDSTIWIGSKNSHTPCHIDTYGYNLIHQIYGRKLWILMPPNENVPSTRIPYEESSVFSKLNFFSPTIEDFAGIKECRLVILNPGEVLYVPNRWWHYVENLEPSISINTWVPLASDDQNRLKEAVVEFLVKAVCDGVEKETCQYILNPNMRQILTDDRKSRLEIINRSRRICKESKTEDSASPESSDSSGNSDSSDSYSSFLKNNDNIFKVAKLTNEELSAFLKKQKQRFEHIDNPPCKVPRLMKEPKVDQECVSLLEALIQDDVIDLITNKLMK